MIRIAQCLCPERHCILAIAWSPADGQLEGIERLKGAVADLIAGKILDPFCGLCGSRDFRYEEGETSFPTMDAAMPVLRELEAQQAMLRRSVTRN